MRVGFFSVLAFASCFQAAGATFGTVVVIGGHASDFALDQRRGQLYIANFAGRRIDVMSTSDNTLGTPISMTTVGESGSIALSPDNRYLLVTNYDDCSTGTPAAPCSFLTGSGRANIMTMSWHMMVDFEPPILACVMSNRDYSFDALRKTRECVINIPTVELAKKVVACGNTSGRDVDKFKKLGFTPSAAASVRAPLIDECYANLECKGSIC